MANKKRRKSLHELKGTINPQLITAYYNVLTRIFNQEGFSKKDFEIAYNQIFKDRYGNKGEDAAVEDVIKNLKRFLKNSNLDPALYNFDFIKSKVEERIDKLSLKKGEQVTNIDFFRKGDKIFKNLNQGIFNNRWYYGKVVFNSDNPTDALVFSDRKLAVNKTEHFKGKIIERNEIRDLGINYKHNLEQTRHFWSNDSIMDFVERRIRKIDKLNLYNQIRELILYYMDLSDDTIADIVTCFVIGTYAFEVFESYA